MTVKQKRAYTRMPKGSYTPIIAGKVEKRSPVKEVMEAFDLVWTNEVDGEKTCRHDNFMKDMSIRSQANKVGYRLRLVRQHRQISRATIAELLNISNASYSRYETGAQPMSVGTLIQLCEILQVMPIELLGNSSPQLWGESQEDCDLNFKLTTLVSRMSIDTRKMLLEFIENLSDDVNENIRAVA